MAKVFFSPCPKPEKPDKMDLPKTKFKGKGLSAKRAEEMELYHKLRPIFLKGKICPIEKTPATDIHHMRGRVGKLLLDMKYWLGVSRKGHKKIEENPNWAKKMGYSQSRLSK